jgi:hypothetical protein
VWKSSAQIHNSEQKAKYQILMTMAHIPDRQLTLLIGATNRPILNVNNHQLTPFDGIWYNI